MLRTQAAGLFGPADDPQIGAIAAALRRCGGSPVHLDPGDFPASLELSDRDGRRRVGPVPDDDICAWYVRFFHVPELPDPAANAARSAFLTSWLLNLEGDRRMVNPVAAMQQNHFKPYQLQRLRGAGLPLPRTLATNDPEEALAFVAEVEDAVYKPVAGGALARAWTPGDAAHLRALRAMPLLFQERLTGTALRVHVLGPEVVDCVRITSPHLDYRTGDFRVTRMALEPAAADVCIRAAAVLGMAFAGVDAFLRPDGSPVVLEVNPTPNFLAYDGVAIAGAIAAYLLGSDIQQSPA